jgi:adenine-specific DNA methylase
MTHQNKILFDNIYPKVNYIGNKEKLANWICSYFPKDTNSIFDAFSGGSSIGYEAKKRGYEIISNDILKINFFLAKSLIENNQETLMQEDINTIFKELSTKSAKVEINDQVVEIEIDITIAISMEKDNAVEKANIALKHAKKEQKGFCQDLE